jgi:hypothetical protein
MKLIPYMQGLIGQLMVRPLEFTQVISSAGIKP